MTEQLVNVDTCTVVQVSEAALPFAEQLLGRITLTVGSLIVLATVCYIVAQYLLKE
jgi:hypothetical protein